MAVKTSWTAGDVLTAADLTDTLAAKLASATAASTYLPIAGGKIVNTVLAYGATDVSTTSETPTALITASITPQSSSNKVLVIAQAVVGGFGGTYAVTSISILRGATLIRENSVGVKGPTEVYDTVFTPVLDTPATTSAVTYTLRMAKGIGTATSCTAYDYSLLLMEVSA